MFVQQQVCYGHLLGMSTVLYVAVCFSKYAALKRPVPSPDSACALLCTPVLSFHTCIAWPICSLHWLGINCSICLPVMMIDIDIDIDMQSTSGRPVRSGCQRYNCEHGHMPCFMVDHKINKVTLILMCRVFHSWSVRGRCQGLQQQITN